MTKSEKRKTKERRGRQHGDVHTRPQGWLQSIQLLLTVVEHVEPEQRVPAVAQHARVSLQLQRAAARRQRLRVLLVL